MKLNHIKIRGAIGLKAYGEDVNINFDQFDSGLIAICGSNGAGKTTLLESLQPWPTMISRNGSLANYFELRDSIKDLEFEYNGHVYGSKISIDAKTGKMEATLFKDGAYLNDGKVPSYKKLCDEIFGSPEIFFKSIFLSQAGERIPQMTAGAKKEFFVGLLGLSRYDKLTEAAKYKAAVAIEQIQKLKAQSEALQITIDRNREKIGKQVEIIAAITDIEQVIAKLQSEIDSIAGDIIVAQKEAEDRRQLNAKLEYIDKEKESLNTDLSNATSDKSKAMKEFDASLSNLDIQISGLQSKIDGAESIRGQFNQLENLKVDKSNLDLGKFKVAELRSQLEKLKDANNQYDMVVEQIANLEGGIAELNEDIKRGDSIKAEKARLDELESQIKTTSDSNQELTAIKVRLNGEKEKARLWSETLQKDIDRLTREYETARLLSGNLETVPCKDTTEFVSTCPMIEAARKASTSANDISAKVKELQKQLEGKYPGQSVIDELEGQYQTRELLTPDDKDFEKLQSEYNKLRSKNLPQLLSALTQTAGVITEKQKQLGLLQEKLNGMAPADPAEIKNIESQIADLNFDQAKYDQIVKSITDLESKNLGQQIKDIEAAAVTIEERKRQRKDTTAQKAAAIVDHDQRIAAIQDKIKAKTDEGDKVKAEIDKPLVYDLPALQKSQKDKSEQHQNQLTVLGESRNALAAITTLVNETEDLELKQAGYDGDIDTLDRELSDWNLLEKAFGKNGLQALELDAAGPAISGIATEMLKEFGRDWSISIATIKSSADEKRQIETFEIMVSTPEGVKNFDKLSGGEKVWIEESIRKAVTIYLINHSGHDYRTIFQDEADGALDPDRAMAFLETSLKAHQLTGAHHTFVITQREEIWKQIPQRIMLNPAECKIEIVRE